MKNVAIVTPTVDALTREIVRSRLEAARAPFDVVEVSPEETISQALRARLVDRDVMCVAAVGGDGTVSAVAHELVGRDIPLGIVPAGTANLVARELGIPLDIEAAAALLTGPCRMRRIDAMRIQGRTYLLNAGVGINAEVIDRTSRLGKCLLGCSAYVGQAVWQALQARPQNLVITIDGQEHAFQATDVLISNCGILARALNPNGPAIHVDDGFLDVSVFCMKTPLAYPWYYVAKSLAPRRGPEIMRTFRAREHVSVQSASPIVVQADGDIIGETPVDIEALSSAVAVRAPTGQ